MGLTQQIPLTTRSGQNVRLRDRKSGRFVGAQRSGLTRLTSSALAGGRIDLMFETTYDSSQVEYTSLGQDPTTEGQIETPNKSACRAAVVDRLGNLYFLDGNSGIVKTNPDLRQVWRIALPAKDAGHVVRALHVDDLFFVYAAVSEGGDMEEAAMWCYRQLDDDKTEQVWELQTGMYVEQIDLRDGVLYTAQNDTDNWKSWVVGYVGHTVKTPTEARKFNTQAYPINGLATSPVDGSIFTAHEPNDQRGADPHSPQTTATAVDWTPKNLDRWRQRVRSWLIADDLDGDGTKNVDHDDGEVISSWIDQTDNLINLVARSAVSETGPTLRKRAIAGRDVLTFNGTSQSMVSGASFSVEPALRSLNKSLLPTHTGAQFAVFVVLRALPEDTQRWLLTQHKDTTASNFRGLFLNRYVSDTLNSAGVARGNVSLYEKTTGSGNLADGTNDHPHTGVWNHDGLCIIAWVHDAGVDDADTNPTRSTLWVNGRPVDRWTSNQITSLLPTYLGWAENSSGTAVPSAGVSRFQGDICEILVIHDYEQSSGDISQPFERQRLLTMPRYPDVAWAANGDTEFEKIIGYLAGAWGMSHKLPAGYYNRLELTANLADGDLIAFAVPQITVSGANWIDSAKVVNKTNAFIGYTFQAGDFFVLTAGTGVNVVFKHYDIVGVTLDSNLELATDINGVSGDILDNSVGGSIFRDGEIVYTIESGAIDFPYEVDLGSTAFATATNLMHAINGSGTPGTTYGTGTEPHPTIMCLGVAIESGTGDNVALYVQTRSGFGGVFSTSESSGSAAWDNSGTAVASVTGAGTDIGHYPHPYFLYRTATTNGSPPPSDPDATSSVASSLNSPYGILAKWNGANGESRWVLTSNYDGSGTGYGGVGFGVIVNSLGDVYSVGPEQESVTAPPVSADNVNIRKVIDEGDTFNVVNGDGDEDAWEKSLTGQDYAYPRMAVDKYDNLFVPLHLDPSASTAVGIRRLGLDQPTDNADIFTQVNHLTGDPGGFCVAVDPNYPDFPPSYGTDFRPEFIFIGTEQQASTGYSVWKIRLVDTGPTTGSHRVESRIAISGGAAYDFTDLSSVTEVSGSLDLDANARFLDYAINYSEVVITDGRQYRIWQPRTSTWGAFRSRSSGQVPLRGRLMASFAGRLFIARFADNPHGWACSAIDDIFNWDIEPPTPTVDQAVAGVASPVGRFPYLINGLAPLDDDNMVVGCAGALFLVRGDPAAGGRIDLIPSPTGMAFGRAWCVGPGGFLWFIGDEGGLWSYAPGGRPQRVSHERLERRMGSINLNTHRPELWWNERDDTLHIELIPYGDPSADTIHFRWERSADAFWEDTFATAELQPCAVMITDGDDPDDRRPLYGGSDGHIRVWDRDAISDDGERIDSSVVLPILNGQEGFNETGFDNLDVQLASQQDGCIVETYAQTEPDILGDPWESFEIGPGKGNLIPTRISGNYVAIRLRGLMRLSGWAFERASVEATTLGLQRVR